MHKINCPAIFLLLLGLYLGCWKEHIALFCTEAAAPIHVYPVRTEMLPEKDQQALEDTISLSGPDELSALLEDFLS